MADPAAFEARAVAVDTALDAGDVERAYQLAEQLARDFPQEPDALATLGDVALEAGDPRRAREAYQAARRAAPEVPEYAAGAAVAAFQLADFDAARREAEAVARRAEIPEVLDLLSRLAERDGDLRAADVLAEQAHRVEPEAFPLPYRMPREEFERWVQRALGDIPPALRQPLDEVAVLIEPVPPREVLVAEDPPLPPDILGLYVGTPRTQREVSQALPALPDRIYLFQHNLERMAQDADSLREQIAVTVAHEVAHHYGFTDDDLEERGYD